MKVKKWTDDEIQILNKVYADYTDDEIKNQFFQNRTKKSINMKASRLGLKKTEETHLRSIQNMANSKREYYKTHSSPRKGCTVSDTSRKKMSAAKKSIGKWVGVDNPRHKEPLFGKDNGRWQGGITDLYRSLRNELGEWQRSSMEYCKYKCVITNGEFEDIHHTYPYNEIMKQSITNIGLDIRQSQNQYTEEEFNFICCNLNVTHNIYGYGACLNKNVHMLFHDQYGYINFTPHNFLDFIYRIDTGEFDCWFEENKLIIDINYEYVKYLEEILDDLEEAI